MMNHFDLFIEFSALSTSIQTFCQCSMGRWWMIFNPFEQAERVYWYHGETNFTVRNEIGSDRLTETAQMQSVGKLILVLCRPQIMPSSFYTVVKLCLIFKISKKIIDKKVNFLVVSY